MIRWLVDAEVLHHDEQLMTMGSTTSQSVTAPRSSTDALRALLDAAKRQPIVAIGALVAIALFITTFWSTLVSLVHRWNSDPNYSHGYLVPLASLYLLHHSIEEDGLPSSVRGGTLTGSFLLILGLFFACATTLVPSLIAECLGMLLVLSGAAILVGGWSWWRYLWAPILFLAFMVPWPSSLYSQAAFPLQLLVSKIAAVLMQVGGIPVLCDGSLIHLPGQTMHVAQACSGLRQLTAFLAMAACLALLVRKPLWYRATLLASAVPIAIVVNVIRVTLTGLAYYFGYGEWTEGIMHTVEGMVMILVGFGVLLLEVQLLDWLLVSPAEKPQRRPVLAGGAAS